MATAAGEQVKDVIGEGHTSKERILASLRRHGIENLDTYAARAAEAYTASQPRPWADIMPELANGSPEDTLTERLFGRDAQRDASNRAHSVPRLPFVVADRVYKASEIKRFTGRPLHYVWDQNLVANGFVRAVVDREEYRELLRPEAAAGGAVARSHVPGTPHTFFQHINFGGNVLTLEPRHAYPDLTRVTMTGFWFWAVSWNDQISSLRTGSTQVILCEHIVNPIVTGATMMVPANRVVPSVAAAWNDRVSAILG